MSLTRRIGHYARRGLPTGRVPGLRLPLPERTDSSESDSTAARSMDSAPYQRTRGHHHGLNPSGRGECAGPPGVRAQAATGSDVGYPSRAPCASCAASLRSWATPRKVRGSLPGGHGRVPRGRLSAPRLPGVLKQREALGSFGCRVAYHDRGSRSVGLRGVGTVTAGEPGMVPGLGQPGPRSRAVSSKATSPCR